MASSTRPTYHQDYIARIRYSNALPPPPCPPKLLDIPNTGLSSGQYTSAGFASRLAREQPSNIEADAELGMPIDLVGIPGVFDGDESAIQAMSNPPPLHPADRALMRAPNALGKTASNAAGISFLRRTEYTTAYTTGGSKFEASNSSNTMKLNPRRQRATDVSKDHRSNIVKHIIKSFNIAYPADAYKGPDERDNPRGAEASPEEKQAWRVPAHPTNTSLRLVDSYPLLPDWDAIPDTGSYMMYKFLAPPTNKGAYDERLDVALLRPIGQSLDDYNRWQAEQDAYTAEKTGPVPIPKYHFEFFLPPSREKVQSIKRNFSTLDPDNEEEISFDQGVDDEGRPKKYFKYENIRTYETLNQQSAEDVYGDVVAVALHDPEEHNEEVLRASKTQKAAYYYPIAQKVSIRPRRPGKIEMHEGEQAKVHIIETAARDPEAELARRDEQKAKYNAVEI
ncbi:Paf1-domain-containing protein [Pleomassaria siparia CBS 279.74]|uniref:Paf1-domain-containing protein n=1 Tax=Pleomassaria siparia CBS 279.74 TaxID=1314801 RepID=A0A6G1KGZ1_9PLEO|nr:Paf1-domain-containing protein [Pleomassaria siparia CBS 279.74]